MTTHTFTAALVHATAVASRGVVEARTETDDLRTSVSVREGSVQKDARPSTAPCAARSQDRAESGQADTPASGVAPRGERLSERMQLAVIAAWGERVANGTLTPAAYAAKVHRLTEPTHSTTEVSHAD